MHAAVTVLVHGGLKPHANCPTLTNGNAGHFMYEHQPSGYMLLRYDNGGIASSNYAEAVYAGDAGAVVVTELVITGQAFVSQARGVSSHLHVTADSVSVNTGSRFGCLNAACVLGVAADDVAVLDTSRIEGGNITLSVTTLTVNGTVTAAGRGPLWAASLSPGEVFDGNNGHGGGGGGALQGEGVCAHADACVVCWLVYLLSV